MTTNTMVINNKENKRKALMCKVILAAAVFFCVEKAVFVEAEPTLPVDRVKTYTLNDNGVHREYTGKPIIRKGVQLVDGATVVTNQSWEYNPDRIDWDSWNVPTQAVNGWTNVYLKYDPDFIDPLDTYYENLLFDMEDSVLDWEEIYRRMGATTASGSSQSSNTAIGATNSKASTAAVKKLTAGKLTVDKVNRKKGTFRIVLKDTEAPSGIAKVRIKVWSKKDKSNLKTYTAKKQKDGSYAVTVRISKHGKAYGTYKAQATVMDKKGKKAVTASIKKRIKKPQAR